MTEPLRIVFAGTPEFAAEAHRQSLMVAQSAQDKDDLAFIDSLYEPSSWDED